MRYHGWLILLAFIGVAVNGQLALSWAAPRPPKTPRPIRAKQVRPAAEDDIVDGYGATAAVARENALAHASKRVEELLRAHFREESWTPDPEQLESSYLERYGVVREQGEPTTVEGANGDRALVARYKVELTEPYRKEVERVRREQRVQERHLILARVLAGLVVVLLVMAGYLRLEDMTRGYATHILRAAAFGLVALASVLLWLTM
jgi:hypothetical protein